MSSAAEIQPELIPATDKNWKTPDAALAVVTPLALMEIALRNNQVEQLQILQDMHFKQMARDAEIEFNQAMNHVQAEIGRIAPNLPNPQTKSKYASYAKLDSVLRPLYTKHGFSLSFDTDPTIPPEIEMVRVRCYVSHIAGHTRPYHKDVPCDGKGAKGGDVMTKTHARGAADSYGMRYLLKMIFNVAIGEEDTDGNAPSKKDMLGLDDWVTKITDAHNYQEMRESYDKAFAIATEEKNQAAKDALISAREAWRARKGQK